MAYALQGNDAAAKKEYQLYLANSPGAPDGDDIRAAINELNLRSKLGALIRRGGRARAARPIRARSSRRDRSG